MRALIRLETFEGAEGGGYRLIHANNNRPSDWIPLGKAVQSVFDGMEKWRESCNLPLLGERR